MYRARDTKFDRGVALGNRPPQTITGYPSARGRTVAMYPGGYRLLGMWVLLIGVLIVGFDAAMLSQPGSGEAYDLVLQGGRVIDPETGFGYWVNEENRWWEADPVLVTSYALLGLQIALNR